MDSIKLIPLKNKLFQLGEKLLPTQFMGLMRVALKMLVAERNKFIGMIVGATFSCFIMTQQPAMIKGATQQATNLISLIKSVDLWVMSPGSQWLESPTDFNKFDIYNIRSTLGVEWAVRLINAPLKGTTSLTNMSQTWIVLGVDRQSLIGLPEKMIAGQRDDIKQNNTLIVDGQYIKQSYLGKETSINIGDRMEFLDTELTVVAISKPLQSLIIHPRVYITNDTLERIAGERKLPSFILVKAVPGTSIKELAERIYNQTGFVAYTPQEFKDITLDYYLKRTSLMLALFIVSTMGFIIGLISIGQIFYSLTLTHLYQFGILKVLGTTNKMIAKMLLFQAAVVGGMGYFFGVLLAVIFGLIVYNTSIVYQISGELLMWVALAIAIIITVSAYLSIRMIFKFDTVELCRDFH